VEDDSKNCSEVKHISPAMSQKDSLLQVSYKGHTMNKEILHRTGSRKLAEIVTERRLCMAGTKSKLVGFYCIQATEPELPAVSWSTFPAGLRRSIQRSYNDYG